MGVEKSIVSIKPMHVIPGCTPVGPELNRYEEEKAVQLLTIVKHFGKKFLEFVVVPKNWFSSRSAYNCKRQLFTSVYARIN